MVKENKEYTVQKVAGGIIIGIIVGLLLGFSSSGNENIKQDNGSLEYQRGVNRGIEISENQYEPMLEQYQPKGDYFICILGNGMMKFIFNDTKAYEEIVNE